MGRVGLVKNLNAYCGLKGETEEFAGAKGTTLCISLSAFAASAARLLTVLSVCLTIISYSGHLDAVHANGYSAHNILFQNA